MKRTYPSMASKASLPPGALVHVGGEEDSVSLITQYVYSKHGLDEQSGQKSELLDKLCPGPDVVWLRVQGEADIQTLSRLGDIYSLHPLLLEDVANTEQHPKLEDFGEYLFAVCRILSFLPDTKELNRTQMSLVLGKGWVLTFEPAAGSVFDPVAQRLRRGQGRIRRMGADYLFYALLDVAADEYFRALEVMEDSLDELENQVLDQPDGQTLGNIYRLKRQAVRLRKAAWPMRETANSLLRDDSGLVSDSLHPFLRDLYDHSVQVLEAVEALRENLSALMDLSLSKSGNHMNQVMKVLTIIATIFIPLTFLAGVYGMNFKHMPELDLPWAYPVLVAVMAAVALGMLAYFKIKKWL